MRILSVLLASVALSSAVPASARQTAPSSQDAWNAPRALALVEQARRTRSEATVDTALATYTARADGFVYFYIDRPEDDEQTLIKTDQLALDVYWKAPDMTMQRIVGRRDEKALPTTIQYHLDHLSVVQDEFEDVIRLGDGDEVGDVPHPVGPGAERIYDYRVADSLSLSYGARREVRVYELQVRPKNPDAPGFVGSVYLDRERAAIVRMSFTFTPASYVDPYLDYIRISLDNALWLDRYWLPYRQEAEIRRELPQLDFLAGSVIRGRFRVGGYEFNRALPDLLFAGSHVTSVSEAQLEGHEFEDPLYSDLREAGLEPSPELEEIERQIREIGIEQSLSGLAPARLHLGSASDLARFNRVEGWALGLGTTLRIASVPVRAVGGWAFAPDRPWARVEAGLGIGATGELTVRARWDELHDIGPIAGASGVVNTITSLRGDDHLDPYRVREVSARWERPLSIESEASLALEAGWSRQAGETLREDADEFRPVRGIVDGDVTWAGVELATGTDTGAHGNVAFRAADGPVGRFWGSVGVTGGWRSIRQPGAWQHDLSVDLGWVSGDAPAQALFLLGGRETLPGYPYRTAVGDIFGLIRARTGRPLFEPWVSAHLLAAVGWTSDVDVEALPPGWPSDPAADGIRSSAGIGLGLLWDVLRVDLARGLQDGGDWEWVFSVAPRFRGWL